MLRRLLPLVLAVVVACAPVALEVCQLTCVSASRGAHTDNTGRDHSCHHHAAPDGTTLTNVPHACGHADELQAAAAGAPPRAKAATPASLAGLHLLALTFPIPRLDPVRRVRALIDRRKAVPAPPVPLRI